MSVSPSLTRAPMVADWLVVDRDGCVIVRSGKVEIGQHIGAALRLLVAEEFGVHPQQVRLAPAVTSQVPDEGYTAGSHSLQHSGEALRYASATARRELQQKAAQRFGVPHDEVICRDGYLRHGQSNQVIAIAELAGEQPFEAVVDEQAPVLGADALRWVGAQIVPANLQGLVTGSACFIHDLHWPGMLHARVIRPANYHRRLVDVQDHGEPPGVHVVRDGSFLAVAGADEFEVLRIKQQVMASARWSDGELSEGDVSQSLLDNPRQSRLVVEGTPVVGPIPAPPRLDNTATTHQARYHKPYQMHGSLGPSAAAALWCDDVLTLWSHSQGIYPLRAALAGVLELSLDQITVHHIPGAGCYGHNGADDAALDAALVALALPGHRVLLKWTREDEHAWEPYASCMSVSVQASLAADGQVVHWSLEGYSDTHVARPHGNEGGGGHLLAAQHRARPVTPLPPSPNMGRHAGIHRNADPIYAFPSRRVIKHLVAGLPLRVSAMRTLGAFANVFAIESFMDEVAALSALDPIVFRLRHLRDQRAIDVLLKAAAMANWNGLPRPAQGYGRGLALAQYKNAQAYAAVVVEVEVPASAQVRVLKAFIAVDAGRAVDMEGLRAQMEGGFVQAMSWALLEEVDFDARGITTLDWQSYPIVRFGEIPDAICVEIIDRPHLPSLGAGEAVSGPAGAAIANAIYAATGVRPRRMPFTPQRLRAGALSGD